MQEHYIGIDVGTGSARACLIDGTGDIKALAAENIKLWQPASGHGSHYVRSPDTHFSIALQVLEEVAYPSLLNSRSNPRPTYGNASAYA